MRETEPVFRATLYFHALENKPKDSIYSVDLNCGTRNIFMRHI